MRTVGCFTDGHGRAPPAAVSLLDVRRRVERGSGCARRRFRVVSRKAGALMPGLAVRESVTVAGRAERARVARAFTVAVLAPGTRAGMRPCCW